MRGLRLMVTGSNIVEVIPTASVDLDMAHCVMFYEYRQSLSTGWLDAVESLFAVFDEVPARITGNVGESNVSGRYSRTKSKLTRLLDGRSGEDEPDIRIDSDIVAPEEEFFPSRMRVAWSTSIGGLQQGVIAIREVPEMALTKTVDAVAPILFEGIGDAYAHAFRFPAAYGPDFYLSAVGAVLSGEPSTANPTYNKRLTQWRDSTWHGHKRPSQGYLREVYPINFITRDQLAIRVDHVGFHDYMKSVGTVHECDYCDDLYRWDIPERSLGKVRQELERTGTILSALVE